jgi:hypothetical protein
VTLTEWRGGATGRALMFTAEIVSSWNITWDNTILHWGVPMFHPAHFPETMDKKVTALCQRNHQLTFAFARDVYRQHSSSDRKGLEK